MIDTINNGCIHISFCRLGQQDPLLRTTLQVQLGSGATGKGTGTFQYQIYLQRLPGQGIDVRYVGYRQRAIIDQQCGTINTDSPGKLAVGTVIAGKVRQGVDIGQFIERNNFMPAWSGSK